MAITNCKKRELVAIDSAYVENLGYSIIDGVLGEIIGDNGDIPDMHLDGASSKEALLACTEKTRINDHIDIFSKTAKIVYDLGVETKIQTVLLRSYFGEHGRNYTIGEFKLYAANNRNELFNKENEIAHERPMDTLEVSKPRNNADWVYDVDGSLRYFGIEILNSNPTDDLIRLSYIALYSNDYTEKKKYVPNCFNDSLIYNLEPKYLTRGELFDDTRMVKVDKKETFSFELKEARKVTKIWVVTKGDARIKIKGFLLSSEEDLTFERRMYNFVATDSKTISTINISVKGNCFVDGIGASTNKYTFKVDQNDIIVKDFMGVGANILPMHFMPESIASGYNEVYWELECARIRKVRPTVARIWFQPDWIADNYEDYKNGNYDYESIKMQSVYKWLDILKEIGTEIEFNFGWKVSSYAQDWYSFQEGSRRNSAPRELDLFSKCCAKLLSELINNRGYSNIKYLTFYNEPDAEKHEEEIADFCVIGSNCDRKVYWEKMMLACRKELDNIGLNYIKMWGCEACRTTGAQTEWINHFKDIPELDCFTTHRYVYKSNKNQTSDYDNFLRYAIKHKPVVISECGQCTSMKEYLWTYNHIAFFCDMVNIGVSGMLLWCLDSIYISDPCNFLMRNFFDMWDAPQIGGGIDNVREVFYEWAMLSRYIKNHGSTVRAKVIEGTDDARISAVINGEDCSVLVELKEGLTPKDIEIKLSKAINKKVYKHLYRRPNLRNGSAIIPPVSAEFMVNDTICDSVSGEYQAILYTTVPPIAQVETAATEVLLKPSEKYELSARMIDGIGDIKYEIAKQLGNSISLNTANNTVTIADDAKQGDMCAIKAFSTVAPQAYNIIVIKVI